jgi:hypothetical protein
VAFLLLGGICAGLRYRALRAQRIATEDSQWELTYSVQFKAETLGAQEEARVRLGVPFETRFCDVVNDNADSTIRPNPYLDSRIVGPYERTQNRLLVLSTRQASETPYTATSKFILRLSQRPNAAREPALENLSADERTWFLRNEDPTQNEQLRRVAGYRRGRLGLSPGRCGGPRENDGGRVPHDAVSGPAGHRLYHPAGRRRSAARVGGSFSGPEADLGTIRPHERILFQFTDGLRSGPP